MANAKCAICGKDFDMKYHCNRNGSSQPWMAHCDTAEHFKVFQIVNGYTGGVYEADEAKLKLESVDTSDKDTYRDNIKAIVEQILGTASTPTPKHDVVYKFVSGTPEHDALPSGVTDQIPETTQADEGAEVTPAPASFDPVVDGGDTWTFTGWTPTKDTMDTDGLEFTGTWTWSATPTAPKHDVTYSFKSGTAEHDVLPEGVNQKVPSTTQVSEGETVTPSAVEGTVDEGNGTWAFKEWQPASAQMDSDGLEFVGVWEWTEKQKHAVTYEFQSGTVEQPTLPGEVTGQLPPQSEAYEGADVTPTPASFDHVSVADGTWTFVSWEPASATMDTDGVNFVGTWTYAATGV